MSRRRTPKFNELEFNIQDTAMVAWSTQKYPIYTFAYYLNKLFHLELAREKEMPIFVGNGCDHIDCIFYNYYDECRQLRFVLFENLGNGRSVHPQLSPFDKILLIIGRDAFIVQKCIHSAGFDSLQPAADPNDILNAEFQELRKRFLGNPNASEKRVLFTQKFLSAPIPQPHPHANKVEAEIQATLAKNRQKVIVDKFGSFVENSILLSLERHLLNILNNRHPNDGCPIIIDNDDDDNFCCCSDDLVDGIVLKHRKK